MLSAGTRLGNFEIVAPLRSGGMAALYLARRRGAAGFDRPVAIKVIHQHFASDRKFVEMFLDEARLAAKIQDPHVVHVEELGEDRGQYFIVMELVHGRSLGELLKALAARGRRMSPACAIHVATQIARGLEAAHEARGSDGASLGVVHRDVSPQNVLLSYRGWVKLIDFGVAKARGQSHHTEADALRGKLAYMSPEQAFGREIDARTDIYALGIVLWEMLTNKRLFSAQNEIALLELVRAPRVAPPSATVPELSPALDEVVLAALAPELDRRIPTAREFVTRLAKLPEATEKIDNGDLAALLAAVAPDEGRSPPPPLAFGPPPASATRDALDTLSVVSDDVRSRKDDTGSTVLALERARDAVTRWRRRAVGIGVAAAIGVTMMLAAAIGASRRQQPDTPAAPPQEPPPPAVASAPIVTSATQGPPAVASAATEKKGTPAARPAGRPTRAAAPPRPDGPSSSSRPQRSVEMIDGVPMVRDETL